MKERPILFSGEMVKAILEGRKTQTRRVLNNRHFNVFWVDKVAPGKLPYWRYEDAHGSGPFDPNDYTEYGYPRCPYGVVGDRLWVRETWQAQNLDGQWWHEVKRENRSVMNWAWTNPVRRAYLPMPPRWLPAIHMPRMACRITLEVLSVRIERVQGISESDAEAEGVFAHVAEHSIDKIFRDERGKCALDYFHKLWDSINAKRGYGWDANPWVWVIEFRQVAA